MIRVQSLNKTYDKRSKSANKVLHDISFSLPDTGFVCILGPSGCGKTSLLNAIGGLDVFDSGTIEVNNTIARRYGSRQMEKERSSSFGYVFQNYHLLQDHSVMYNVYLGMHSLALSHKEKTDRAKEVLKTVGMELYARRVVGELSGGQQQRVAIARALARKPRVIFADEPTGNLDEANTVNICSLLRKISKSSLVIMVTHEERIARFFADRIITLEDGRIISDSESWQRDRLSFDSSRTIYAGEYNDSELSSEKLALRMLTEEGAEPVSMTVIALKDRVVIKLSDKRKVSCVKNDEPPVITEGKRPEMAFENTEKETDDSASVLLGEPLKQKRAGSGISAAMILREARHLIKRPGTKNAATRVFLVLLAALTLFTAGDFLTVAHIDPRTFITSHSDLLSVTISRGNGLDDPSPEALLAASDEFIEFINTANTKHQLIPRVSASPRYTDKVFKQMISASAIINGFSFMPLSALNEDTIVYGRMPQKSDEIVVDIWVLEKLSKSEGVIQNGIPNVEFFINKKLVIPMSAYSPTIVGICDSGDPAMYLSKFGIVSAHQQGIEVMPFSELKKLLPNEFGSTVLAEGECIVLAANAGAIWAKRIGRDIEAINNVVFTIADAYEYSVDTNAFIAINDSEIDKLYNGLIGLSFLIHCEDKEAMKSYISENIPERLANELFISVTDDTSDAYAEQEQLAKERIGARTVVTVTVIAVSMIMLWLLQRSKLQGRIGMIAIYKLLCIPKGKLISVFATETLLVSLTTTLPVVAVTFGILKLISGIPDLGYSVYLPWQAALITFLCIFAYHLTVSLLPVIKLLAIPPAKLAAKYDF